MKTNTTNTQSKKSAATAIAQPAGQDFYTEITGAAFEHVVNDDGSEYKFNPSWRCTGFADTTNPKIPERNPNYVFPCALLQDLLIFLMYPQNTALWLSGPTGCGKSSAIRQVASRLNWPVIDLTINNHFEFTDIKGQWGLSQAENESTPTMKFLHYALPFAMQNGCIFVMNEGDLASPGELSALNDVIEGNSLVISENQSEIIKPHPMFRLVVTANSNGAGDSTGLYAGVQQQNVAGMDRYRVIKVTYPSQSVEEDILSKVAPYIDKSIRSLMCQYVNEIRKGFNDPNNPGTTFSFPFSTRSLVNWASSVQYYSFTNARNTLKRPLEIFFANKLSPEEFEAANSLAITVFGEDWNR